MHADPLPYRLDPLHFPFPALAQRAGTLPLGGGREVALGTLVVLRLGLGMGGLGVPPLPTDLRTARAGAAKVWLASLALPAATRQPLARCLDATTTTGAQYAGALRTLALAAHGHLDGPSLAEIEQAAETSARLG